jgi:hypothetical protein
MLALTLLAYGLKDLANEMCVCPRTVTRWWKRLRVPPDKCTVKGCHRWSRERADKLLEKWRRAGGLPSLPVKKEPVNQLKFNFDAKQKPTFPKHFTHPPSSTAKGPRAPRQAAAAQ